MDALQPLLGTTLILVAHPDDEVIACGGLMQTMKRAVVAFATDGAPQDEGFWKQYGSRQAYAGVRRREAELALSSIRATGLFLGDHVDGGIADQQLFRDLRPAVAAVERIITQVGPECFLTLAYEGGHPDHDAVCFISSVVGRRAGIPVWEAPLYHRNGAGATVTQAFPQTTGTECEATIEGVALEKKVQMLRHYLSQGPLLDSFRPQRETFRPLAGYDFTQPPLPGKLNYEVWQWKMTGKEVSAAFSAFLDAEKGTSANKCRTPGAETP